MEIGELVEAKVKKTRSIKLKTYVYATADTTATLSKPLLTRIMVFSLTPSEWQKGEDLVIIRRV
ncbi:MAG: hypothetical protein WA667_20925, partial [Candidatus Nitrosopolaris sp.]